MSVLDTIHDKEDTQRRADTIITEVLDEALKSENILKELIADTKAKDFIDRIVNNKRELLLDNVDPSCSDIRLMNAIYTRVQSLTHEDAIRVYECVGMHQASFSDGLDCEPTTALENGHAILMAGHAISEVISTGVMPDIDNFDIAYHLNRITKQMDDDVMHKVESIDGYGHIMDAMHIEEESLGYARNYSSNIDYSPSA